MQADFLKNLVALLAQAGGNVTFALSDLRAIGLELTLTNISSDTQGSITLRLGAKIYYVPAKVEEQQWPTRIAKDGELTTSNGSSDTATGVSGQSAVAPQEQRLQNRISEEIGAINRINNRPRSVSTPPAQSLPKRRSSTVASSSGELPPSPVGVYQTSDLSSYLREREVADARERYQHRQERRNKPGAGEGVMPFRVMDSPPKPPQPQE